MLIKKIKSIGPSEKGIKKERITSVPKGTYKDIDLRFLPKFICYKAALIREKMFFQFVVATLSVIHILSYITNRIEINNLYQKLREKEYILAPGVLDFTTASPQAVPESYVNDASTDFLSDLGNINARNINEQYQRLSRFMSDDLKVKFELETQDWIEEVRRENIAQILTIKEKEIRLNPDGSYHVIAQGKAEFYANQHYLGHEDQVIEMSLKLVPPERGKRWYLQIFSLNWSKADTFRLKQSLSQDTSN